MGRAVATKGHSGRRLGRTIRNLESSVELSSNESHAKEAEKRYKEKVAASHRQDDSPIQKIRPSTNAQKNNITP